MRVNKELKEVCDMIGQEWSYLDSSPDKLIEYIKEKNDDYNSLLKVFITFEQKSCHFALIYKEK